MNEGLKRILRFVTNKGKPSEEIVEIEFDGLTPEEQKQIGDIHNSYCKRKVMEVAQKDKRAAERVHKFAELVKKNKNN